jgi:aspartate/methionine/tyrosine aminotransferase
MTGWRVGWLIAPPDIAKAAATLQSHQTSNVANVAQKAALAAVTGPLDAVAAMREAFDRRRRTMYEMLSAIEGVSVLEPEGAFYAFPNFSKVLGRPIGESTAATTLDLAEIFLEQAKVAVVPGEAFGAPGYARLSFALGDDDLTEGIGRIADLLDR